MARIHPKRGHKDERPAAVTLVAQTTATRSGTQMPHLAPRRATGVQRPSHHVSASTAVALLEPPHELPLEHPATLVGISAPTVARRRILIVEDDPIAANVVRAALELEGEPEWEITVTGSGSHALDLAGSITPHLVLLDLLLPGIDGAEVYRRLQADGQTSGARVVFLTAATSIDLYQRGIESGVLLRKPFDVRELVGLVRTLLAEESPAPAASA